MNYREVAQRYHDIYVPAVCDCLDRRGYWNQVVHSSVQPLKLGMKVAGPAYTMLGMASREMDKTKRLAPQALDEMPPDVVAVLATSGDENTGHWGELMTNAAIYRGCAGAVVDGGIRDTWNLLQMDFPLFYRFRSSGDSLGRFNVVEYQTDIVLGGVRVRPGDFVFGDSDGVVIIPKHLIVEVLEEAESVVETEKEIRERVRRGEPVAKLYLEYEQF